MGMEVAGSELPLVNGDVKTKVHDQENGKIDFSEEITFGSHGVDEQVKVESTKVSNANVHQAAADEWGETKVHYFWFVRHRSFEDPSLRAKIDQADKEIQKKQQQINQLYEEIKLKKTKRHELIQEKKALNAENDQYREFINEKREEMKPLQTALGSLRGGGGGGGEKGGYVCSTEEELNQRIRSLEYQMQHESLSLKEEKQLLREIKELEATRPKVVANTAARAKIQESLGEKEAIQDQVKLLGTDLDGVRKQQAAVKAKRELLNPQIDALTAEIDALDKEINNAKGKREEAYNTVKQIRKLINEKNAHLDEYKNNINLAKEISFQKDVKALEEFHHTEVEKFLSQWNSSKTFRDDYVKRSLRFNVGRQLCKDGRMMNDDEKPMVKEESPKPSEPDVAPKTTPKPHKEALKPTSKVENLPSVQAPKESKKGKKELKSEREVEEEEVFVVGKPKNDVSKDREIDPEKLKEMKKEEEKEKNKQALERKKKMQEKAAAKAAARAQKEAEKKQKEREKKQRKKEGSNFPPNDEEEPAELVTDESEKPDDVEEVVETPVTSKAKAHPNSLKNRKPVKSRGAPPKAILKKKKSDKYLLYGSVAAAALAVVLLVVIGYKYFV